MTVPCGIGKPCQQFHLQRLARAVVGQESGTAQPLVESGAGHGYDATSDPAVDRVLVARRHGSAPVTMTV